LMTTLAAIAFRLLCALLAGAQVFFIAAATQVIFPKDVAALPHGDPRRTLAADLVGKLLARLDAATIVGCAVAIACVVFLSTRGGSLRPALLPLLAASCALASAFWTTPAIRSLRAAGLTQTPSFGLMHAVSSSLLLVELVLLLIAAARPWRS
ncbi:MAG: hypothetical protein JST92_11250, partial [Deltaproteobacteria bacterium]|nr:hypothetical protein [Deltaproteobacteria bacterium]